MLRGKKIVIGVSGGIAAYKACELVSRLKKNDTVLGVQDILHRFHGLLGLSFLHADTGKYT